MGIFKKAGPPRQDAANTPPSRFQTEEVGVLPATPTDPSSLAETFEGFIDLIDGNRIIGWAYDPSAPGRQLLIEISAGDTRSVAIANVDRPDLRSAGKGDGYCGFDVAFDVARAGANAIHVREISTGWELTGSPIRFDLLHLLASPLNRSRLNSLRSEAHLALSSLKGPA